jgi:hypothetical protein
MTHIRGWSLASALVIVLTVLGISVLVDSPHSVDAGVKAAPPKPMDDRSVADGASLHNPGFDNHTWYDFNERYSYGVLSPHSWMPDDDTAGGPQDWRIWYLNGAIPILTWASTDEHAASTDRAVKSRTYWDGKYHAGIYQVVPNATPCLTYQFQMYGRAKPGDNDSVYDLQVGIDREGYYPPDVAVHNFPSSIVWGISHPEYTTGYGLLSVTAEAWGDTITVFTYADADGGEILWDTGSFQEVTPADLIDPDDPPAPSGIYSLQVSTSKTSATVNWSTASDALGQIYYRFVNGPSTPPSTETYSHTVYLPYVARPRSPWLSTELNKSATASHSQVIGSLKPGSTYEYLVVSRGLLGGECVTWVSDERTFTTNP